MNLNFKLVPFYNCDVQVKGSIQEICSGVLVSYTLTGDCTKILIPRKSRYSAGTRKDELWNQTCFELYCKKDSGYLEWNFSPNHDWNYFSFTGYRKDMICPLIDQKPLVDFSKTPKLIEMKVLLPQKLITLTDFNGFGLNVILKLENGKTEYYGLNHPPEKPDFHSDTNFFLSN